MSPVRWDTDGKVGRGTYDFWGGTERVTWGYLGNRDRLEPEPALVPALGIERGKPEDRQCFAVARGHVAAGALMARHPEKAAPTPEEVRAEAAQYRAELWGSSQAALCALSDAPPWITATRHHGLRPQRRTSGPMSTTHCMRTMTRTTVAW